MSMEFRAWKKPQGDVPGRYATEDELLCLLLRSNGALSRENHNGTMSNVSGEYEIELWTGFLAAGSIKVYDGDKITEWPEAEDRFIRTVTWDDWHGEWRAMFSDGSGFALFTRKECLRHTIVGTIHDKKGDSQ